MSWLPDRWAVTANCSSVFSHLTADITRRAWCFHSSLVFLYGHITLLSCEYSLHLPDIPKHDSWWLLFVYLFILYYHITSYSESGETSCNGRLTWPYLWYVNLVLKGQGADSQTPAPERPVVQEGEGRRVYGAERSHPRAPVASGAVWTSVSERAFLSSVVHYVTLTHPEVRRKKKGEKAH